MDVSSEHEERLLGGERFGNPGWQEFCGEGGVGYRIEPGGGVPNTVAGFVCKNKLVIGERDRCTSFIDNLSDVSFSTIK